ncbi:hypothetical protein ElyMa_004556100 [Elysia marginata]|uniref:Transmembrane protein n=1 Tax=Elysia marginata TaxID=1093978 RepID=A0AAV4HRZ5_9GAST|nr:hypothetical protein ElyMa_004556100 [Elysia marginata]
MKHYVFNVLDWLYNNLMLDLKLQMVHLMSSVQDNLLVFRKVTQFIDTNIVVVVVVVVVRVVVGAAVAAAVAVVVVSENLQNQKNHESLTLFNGFYAKFSETCF